MCCYSSLVASHPDCYRNKFGFSFGKLKDGELSWLQIIIIFTHCYKPHKCLMIITLKSVRHVKDTRNEVYKLHGEQKSIRSYGSDTTKIVITAQLKICC